MNPTKNKILPTTRSRRHFIKTSGAAAGAVAATIPSFSIGENLKTKKLKVGQIGCGGRGNGAASQALKADENVELWAVAELYQEKIDTGLAVVSKGNKGKINCPPKRQFVGLDAWEKVLNSGVDVVLLTTTPAFRPMMFEEAVKRGIHVFCEKPMGVDVPGVLRVAAAAKEAKQKGLSVMSGFCWRYNQARREAFKKIQDGEIGDVRSVYASYYTSPVKTIPEGKVKPEQMSDVEWQISNWHNFIWLSGDSIVEQAIHSVDKIAWAMGDVTPLTAVGMGGREQPNPGGQIYDHFAVCYEFPNNIRCFMNSRQQRGTYNENADYVTCTDGVLVIGRSSDPYIVNKEGRPIWRYRSKENSADTANMYQQEHDELFASIRNDSAHNDGEWMCNSTLIGIMGRNAAYTGQLIKWEDVLADETNLMPDSIKWDSYLDIGPTPVPGMDALAVPQIKA
ncbi:MAG: Gfo/Idh/MocA family oxidoreductase [Verrucomicrobiota bacterium]